MDTTFSCGNSPANLSYSEKERFCEFQFKDALERYGSFWHVFTPGNLTEIINTTPDDFRFAVSNMAISAHEAGVIVVTDNQMENHLHGLLGGTKEQCVYFVDVYRYREEKYLDSTGRRVDLRYFRCDDPILVTDLEMMRNEIVYINRNGFVSDSRYLPFSYPWGGGNLYFNPFAQCRSGTPFNEIPFDTKRFLIRRRISCFPDNYTFDNGMIQPCSYVDNRLGESFFRDSHHYLNMLTKNVEAYSQDAKRFGDAIVLGREEMYAAVKQLCLRDFNIKQPSMLNPEDKLVVARTMHYDYHASNAQIRMILKMSEYEVDSMFPLKSLK